VGLGQAQNNVIIPAVTTDKTDIRGYFGLRGLILIGAFGGVNLGLSNSDKLETQPTGIVLRPQPASSLASRPLSTWMLGPNLIVSPCDFLDPLIMAGIAASEEELRRDVSPGTRVRRS